MSATVQAKTAPGTAENVTPQKDPFETFGWLPCQVTLEIPVVKFTVGDLLKLKKGSLVETARHHTSDIPLRVNRELVAWTEFEVVGENLAVRVTELS